MMRKLWAALMAAVIAVCGVAACAAGYGNGTDMYVSRWSDAANAAEMKILPRYGVDPDYDVVYAVTINRGAIESGRTVWKMTAHFDEGSRCLLYAGGSRAEVTYNADGSVASSDTRWQDASGSLSLGEDGIARWSDSRDDEAAGFAFNRVVTPAPTVEEYYGDFFSPIASVETGTAGASLKAAKVAESALLFAYRHDFWNIDADAMRDNMLTAYQRLPEDMRGRFDENFDALMTAVDTAFEDYESVSALFEDAGVAKNMSRLVRSAEVLLSWEMLSSNVLTMGSTDASGDAADAVG